MTLAPYDRHFRRHDRVLHGVIKQVGPFGLKPSRDHFGMLVRSIISQQISIGAARAIRGRLEQLVGSKRFTPAALAILTPEKLRTAGISAQKASYLLDLAGKVHGGEVQLARLSKRTDEEIIEELIEIKGIGRWTAQMFLIFALGRPDVFPIDDFGVRSAMTRLYELPEKPPRSALLEIGQRWSPFASVGSWYCWRYLELVKQQTLAGKKYPV